MNTRIIMPGVVGYSDILEDPMALFRKADENNSWFPATAAYHGDKKSTVIPDIRTGFECIVSPSAEIDLLSKAATECLKDYKTKFYVNIKSREGWSMLKYNPGDFFTYHTDDSHEHPRRLSLVYYPNDNYEGGELEFSAFNTSIKPLAGELIMFPSSYLYVHRANRVTSGTKYCALTFMN